MCKKPAFKDINKSNYKTYNSRKWRKLSKSFKARNPLCIHCKANGITKASEVTDHINPIDKGGNIWDESNFQALCHKHHNKKSGRSK